MAHLAKFLDKYDIILFDMDGVVTSENSYWTSAALTVYEWLYSDSYYGKKKLSACEIEQKAEQIRKELFFDDEAIKVLKSKGVNSNWDLGYIYFAVAKILDTLDCGTIFEYIKTLGQDILAEYDRLGKLLSEKLGVDAMRNGKLWYDMVLTFQEWYWGDELYEREYKNKPVLAGKKGFVHLEQPVVDVSILKKVFALLSESKKRIATATGRPANELYPALRLFDILKYFSEDGIVNYTHIINAEKETSTYLTKPHPYIFQKAMLGENYPDEKIIAGDFDKDLIKKTLVVGDAGADILSARAMGADFCAVLTGVAGESGRAYFEEMKAEYICKSLADFLEV